ncbi:MADS-box transcription factor PHERES 2 [Bienertia sinuspersici]
MARTTGKKVNLSYITRDSARKITLKKRRKGLLKKMEEITTLCDVESCAIIYSHDEKEPTLFPNDPSKVLSVISNFMNLAKHDQTRKMFNQENLLMENISKANEKLKKLQEENHDKRLFQLVQEHLFDQNKSFQNLTYLDLVDLKKLLKCYLSELDQRIENFERELALDFTRIPPFPISESEETNMGSPSNVSTNQGNNDNLGQENVLVQVQFEQWFEDMMRNLLHDEVGTSNKSFC